MSHTSNQDTSQNRSGGEQVSEGPYWHGLRRPWKPVKHCQMVFMDKLPDRKSEKPAVLWWERIGWKESQRMGEETHRLPSTLLCLWSLLLRQKRPGASMPCC